MDLIHEIADLLPIHLNKALEMINSDDPNFEERFRNCLQIIENNSEKCMSLSEDTEDKFKRIVDALMELQESCICTKGMQKSQMKIKENQIEENKKIKQRIQEKQKLHRQRLSRLKEETLEAEKKYQYSLRRPGALGTVGMGIFINNITRGIRVMLTGLTRPLELVLVELEKEKDEDFVSSAFQADEMKSQACRRESRRAQEIYCKEETRLKEESNKRLDDAVDEMVSLEIRNVDYKKMITIFNQSIKSLGEVQEHWVNLVQYFQSVGKIIECSLNVSLRGFGGYAKEYSPESEMTELKITLIYYQVVEAKCLLSGLIHIAGTYTQVSTEFLLPITKQLRCLLGSTKNDSIIEADIKVFKEECSKVKTQIENTIRRNKATFQLNIESEGSVGDVVEDFL